MSVYARRSFWVATAERALSTFAQVEGAFLLAAGTDLLHTDWQTSVSVAGMASVLAVLKCVAAGSVGEPGPSLTSSEAITPPAIVPAGAEDGH